MNEPEGNAGVRLFECDNCGEFWRDYTRNCYSASKQICNHCDVEIEPYDYEVIHGNFLDKNGNIMVKEMAKKYREQEAKARYGNW